MKICERSTESEAEDLPEICALLKADLLENVDACTKFVDNIGKVVVCSDSFAKLHAYSRRSSLLARIHKTLIMVAESMRVDHDAVKCVKEGEVVLMTHLRSAAKKIEKLESELAVLKGPDVFAPTSVQLETANQEVVHLKAKLSTTQAMLEVVGKEVRRVSPVVKDLDRVNSELQFACFAKDEELVFMYAEVSHLKDVVSKLESMEVDMQGAPSDYEFFEKDFETFSISPVDLLGFSFEAAFDGATEG